MININWNFDNTYEMLPEIYFTKVSPEVGSKPKILYVNKDLADSLGLDYEGLLEDGGKIFAAGKPINEASNIAMAYTGHQFGNFVMLGDGRAMLLGEQITPSGKRFDIQLKGSGRTPYSRGGDGKAALGPMLREYLISEAMFALNIPTTRALAISLTGDRVIRQKSLDGAVLTRVASSHIRVGTFQYSAYAGDNNQQREFANYAIKRHYPDILNSENPYLELFKEVVRKQASLIAKWQAVGFVHGVMNTDNMTISGETIDYGPCAFIDKYDPDTVFSSIDWQGRYAYKNQGPIGAWNLARFAESLIELVDESRERAISLLTQELEKYEELFNSAYYKEMTEKIGIENYTEEDKKLVDSLIKFMEVNSLDYTNTFVDISNKDFSKDIYKKDDFKLWQKSWEKRLQESGKTERQIEDLMKGKNPRLIPRNYWVDLAIKDAEGGDFTLFEELFEELQKPFDYSREAGKFKEVLEDVKIVTYCGT
ncbi:MAG: YdiU family protein [Tissierellia bacterium]|nr:YdiU family protein [Tissierellia bacterium]